MGFADDEEMMDCGEGNEETYFTSIEWPDPQSAWLSRSKPLVYRSAVSGVPHAGEMIDLGGKDELVISTGKGGQLPAWFEYRKPMVHRPAVSGVPAVEGSSSWFGGDGYARPLVLRPAVPGVMDTEGASSQVMCGNRTKPLVLRPAAHGVPVVKDTSPQVVQKTRTKSLVHRPALLKNPRRHNLAEQARIVQLQSTLPHRPRVTDKSRDSRRRFKEAVRKRTERKREREERERRDERKKLGESRGSDQYENSHCQIDPAIIKQEIQDIHADLSRAFGNDEHETLQACNPPNTEWHEIIPISETKMSTDTLISVLVAKIMKERQHVDEVKNFVNKKHTLEEWQNWGKILAERMDKEKRNWEEYREMRRKEESRDLGGPKFDPSMRGEWAWEPLSIQSVYGWLDKLDKILEEAENRSLETHCESKEVERESVEQRAAKREKTEFVERHVRAYVESDSDDTSAVGPGKRKQLPLRQKKKQNSHAR